MHFKGNFRTAQPASFPTGRTLTSAKCQVDKHAAVERKSTFQPHKLEIVGTTAQVIIKLCVLCKTAKTKAIDAVKPSGTTGVGLSWKKFDVLPLKKLDSVCYSHTYAVWIRICPSL